MANILQKEKRVLAINALAEGNSIRSIERITGVHRDTIMRLGVRVGQACENLLDEKMRNLNSTNVQVDELWGFIGKKQKNASQEDYKEGLGDVWTFVGIDAETKIVPCYMVGKRDSYHAKAFLSDLASRLTNRIQLSSDSLRAYIEAVEVGFGSDVDYGQIVKTYSVTDLTNQGRYSPAEVVKTERSCIVGKPQYDKISTSIVERQNLTMRMHCRRLTRLTNAFSKKLENFKAAIGLHFAYYNFVKIHGSLRTTPAMAAGVTDRLWTVEDLIGMSE
ncbi:MAG: IS1 family transposase [Verrucomicrobiia bacterium]